MLKFIYRSLPGNVKHKLKTAIYRNIKANRFNQGKNLPYIELTEKHIKNLKVVVNRKELLKLLPQGGVVAELGVDKGGFSDIIIKEAAPRKFHLVDAWGSDRYNEGLLNEVKQKFRSLMESGLVEINRGFSTEVGKQFPDQYFDWIYIDTSHSYKTTKEELELYARKVKNDGIIAGHDFVIGNWNGDVRYGVIEAVYEFCVKNDWEIIYLTTEMYAPSFAIRKILS